MLHGALPCGMFGAMSAAEIKEAITKLSPREYCDLMAELPPTPDDEGDSQMKADAAAGTFDAMKARALAEHESGMTQEWP